MTAAGLPVLYREAGEHVRRAVHRASGAPPPVPSPPLQFSAVPLYRSGTRRDNPRVSLRVRIALGTLCAFNAFTLTLLGILALLFVNGPARYGAIGFWLGAAGLVWLGRRLRQGTDW